MPNESMDHSYPATATKAVLHGAPVVEDTIAGIAIKSAPPPVDSTVTTRKQVQIGEKFHIRKVGKVLVPVGGLTAPKGTAIYIVAATNALTTTASTNPKFGKVVDVANENACPVGFIRVSLGERGGI